MKKELTKAVNKIWMLIAALLINVVAFAQDKGVDVNVNMNKGDSSWYNNPWVWIVGAAVFILLLVAIVRGGRTSD